MENSNRKNNIILYNVPQNNLDQDDENVYSTVIDFCNSNLDVNIQENDINYCLRLKSKSETKPILLSLVHYKNKQLLFKNVIKLKDTNYSISDDLTPKARQQKQLIYKKFVEAKQKGFVNVKKYKNFILINNQKVYYKDLISDNWLDYLKEVELDGAVVSRKNSTGSVSSTGSNRNQGNGGGPRRGQRRGGRGGHLL